MVELVFMFTVPREKQEEFLNFVKSGTKPYWESHGCLGYNVWQARDKDSFMKRMEFQDMATFEKVLPSGEQNPEGKALIQKFHSFVENVTTRVYTRMT